MHNQASSCFPLNQSQKLLSLFLRGARRRTPTSISDRSLASSAIPAMGLPAALKMAPVSLSLQRLMSNLLSLLVLGLFPFSTPILLRFCFENLTWSMECSSQVGGLRAACTLMLWG
uniref:Uncharacterized protein n=1 Tax=Opuntia streptacantha TaxID=393608 RepID=A0A7C9DHW2_OPUST